MPSSLLRDLAGDADDGDGVEHGGGDAGDQVGGAGAAGGHADADAARGARVAVGHVRGALLMAHEDVVDGKLAQRVVDGQDGAAGIAEDVAHAFAFGRCPDDFRAGDASLGLMPIASALRIGVGPLLHRAHPFLLRCSAVPSRGYRALRGGR